MRLKKKQLLFKKQKYHFDTLILFLVVVLCLFGLVMIYETSSVSALSDFNDKLYYFKEQLKWFVIGIFGLVLGSTIDYRRFYSLAVPLLLLTLILLSLVFFPGLGISAYGARRWLNLGFTILQPAELTKLTLIIYLSAWFSNKEKKRFLAFLILIAMVVGLVVLEPDLGTALIIGIVGLILYFLSEAPLFHFLLLLPISIVTVVIAALISPYRYQRIITFLNPTTDPLGASYHIRQILISLGSGGLMGLGLGKSIQKYQYLPEATTDSIFAIIGEEMGFIGASVFVFVFVFFLFRCFKIARQAPDKFGFLLGMGITFWLGVQTLINLSAMTALLPLTGVPLPFISYGGSGLVVALFSVGIILNISKHHLVKK